ncbi:hypothetical protein VR611_01125 [Aquirufa nivalisilvae]
MIRRAELNDISSIVDFIKMYWNKNHIYVVDRNYFYYEFVNDNKVNFIISLDINEDIDGILGFIEYDKSADKSEIFTAMWMVRPNLRNPLVGPNLIRFLVKCDFTLNLSTLGLSSQAYSVLKMLKFQVGEMKHFYFLNPKIKHFNLIEFKEKIYVSEENLEYNSETKCEFYEYKDENEIKFIYNELKNVRPIKSFDYFKKKYLRNPYFNYYIFGIKNLASNNVVGLLIIRKIDHEGSSALRIIDFFGNHFELSNIKSCISDLLDYFNSEYIDFYQYGIEESILRLAGFKKNEYVESVIIPNYYQPFEKCNVRINFSTNISDTFYFFKGDGDQDRPNLILK